MAFQLWLVLFVDIWHRQMGNILNLTAEKKTLSYFFGKNNPTLTQILRLSYKLYITLTLKLPHIATLFFLKIRKSYFLATNGLMHHIVFFSYLHNVNLNNIDLMHGSVWCITSNGVCFPISLMLIWKFPTSSKE